MNGWRQIWTWLTGSGGCNERQIEKRLMTALQNLNQAVTDLTAAVSAAGTALSNAANNPQIQAAADAVEAQVAILNAAVAGSSAPAIQAAPAKS